MTLYRAPMLPAGQRGWSQISCLTALLVLLLLFLTRAVQTARPPVVSRRVRYLLFPPLSNMGLEAAISIPVRPMVNVALNLEANYVLPWNTTQFYAPGSLAREDITLPGGGFGITRRRAYMTMETIMSKFGLNGRSCLLRAICETSESSLRHNGLFGDLIYIIFTPSSSNSEDLPPEFAEAEEHGQHGDDCQHQYSQCSSGIFQLFTTLADG